MRLQSMLGCSARMVIVKKEKEKFEDHFQLK